MKAFERKGIAVAGSILVDKINEISAYPPAGELTQIRSIQYAAGGCVPNVAIDLKKIAPSLPVRAVGKIGNDSEGKFLSSLLLANGVFTQDLAVMDGEKTSFTEVMSIPGGQRTFFVYPGASADFGIADMDFGAIHAKILHLGYFLLLQKVDNGDGLKILQAAKERGIETSIDLVSENSDRYNLVLPCLPYTDYLIVNELEAGRLAGIEPITENLERIARRLMELGVQKKVIIHMPERSVCLSKEGYSVLGSYILPDGYIQGTTGAGDAFCAGALIGIYNGWNDMAIMEFASSCSVMALSCPDATGGMKTETEIKDYCKQFTRREAGQ
ncbi:MAG: carbohydrate kinase family protein [Oscillospiraceae bacterium]|nr:carbohydrate kinase family protein [Oscillospiraceae bacterium]